MTLASQPQKFNRPTFLKHPRKTTKEKVWLHLLAKDEVMLDYRLVYSPGLFYSDNGECRNLSGQECAEKVFNIKGKGDKNIRQDQESSYYSRNHLRQ